MGYDTTLADRVRAALGDRPGLPERRMFGGIAFMLLGNIACGVINDDLVVRVGDAGEEDTIARPHVRPMDFTGHPMRGWVYVAPAGVTSDADLHEWVDRGVRHALSLPPK